MKSVRHLVLGAARSGKTGFALNMAKSLAQSGKRPVVYVATAEANDLEMQERIVRHRDERPRDWRTLEAPRKLGHAVTSIEQTSVVVVDCLTLWLSNALLCDFREEQPMGPFPVWSDEREAFLSWLERCAHSLIVISNEVGGGIVPVSALARRFQSEQGWLNQDVARVCEQVTLVVAGLPVAIKTGAQGHRERSDNVP